MDIASSNKAMWRGALIPSMALGILALVVSTIVQGSSGLLGSALATFTVAIFFSVSLLVGRLTKNADPISTMALAMFSYFTKLLLIAGFLIAVTRLTDESEVDRTSFGVSALVIATGWLAGEVRAFSKLRLQLPLPQNPESKQDGES
jgi:ATP synthase protein I